MGDEKNPEKDFEKEKKKKIEKRRQARRDAHKGPDDLPPPRRWFQTVDKAAKARLV